MIPPSLRVIFLLRTVDHHYFHHNVQICASYVRAVVFTLKERDFYFYRQGSRGRLPSFVDLCRIYVMVLIRLCYSFAWRTQCKGLKNAILLSTGAWGKRQESLRFHVTKYELYANKLFNFGYDCENSFIFKCWLLGMTLALVFVNCDYKGLSHTIKALKRVKGVIESNPTSGAYDAILKITANSDSELGKVVRNVAAVSGVIAIVTSIVVGVK